MLIAVVDGGRNCGKAKKIQEILAEKAKRGERCLYLSRHDQKMLRGAGHPAIDMLTYILAKEEERGCVEVKICLIQSCPINHHGLCSGDRDAMIRNGNCEIEKMEG